MISHGTHDEVKKEFSENVTRLFHTRSNTILAVWSVVILWMASVLVGGLVVSRQIAQLSTEVSYNSTRIEQNSERIDFVFHLAPTPTATVIPKSPTRKAPTPRRSIWDWIFRSSNQSRK